MNEVNPFETQRDAGPTVITELNAAGFDDTEEIRHGGFGVVYRSLESGLGRTVAVKVLTADLDEENRARFFREQQAMALLTGHPNIVDVLQVGATQTGRPYLVMPYHEKGSLDERIRRSGPLPLDESLRFGVKMAGALESAHGLWIVHRDVKPANILSTNYGEPALADFGIAHVSDGFQTATGTVTGSPAFTAPEVLKGDRPGPASDVYGLGATLFSALTGHAAFERHSGEQGVTQFLRIASQPVPNLRENGIADDISAIVERAMSRDPAERTTAAALGEELRLLQTRHGFPVSEMALRIGTGSGQQVPSTELTAENKPVTVRQSSAVPRAEGNLPAELTSLVGRRTETAEAKSLLAVSRLVTFTGIGGVGKTRLSLQVAQTERRNYPDGVWLVELSELHDDALLVDVVAASLGLRDRSGRPLLEVLVAFLRSRELLIIFDNCEQVIAGSAELADRLLRECPEVRILATSREPLDIGGESVLRLAPLTVPDTGQAHRLRDLPRYDSVRLFIERAGTAVPGFALTEDNHQAVACICSRLDGLPLAIELAAARLRMMSPQQILQRLNDRYRLLTRGGRNVPSRQQTLRLSIDWSYELCSPTEQLVWARLSVFAGAFELAAAEDVCGSSIEPDDILDVLSSLVDKSILIREETRGVIGFRLLETLRDYGREKIQQTGEYTQLRRRHLDWYQQLAREADNDWISPRQLEWITRLEREQSNLREALTFSLSDDDNHSALRMVTALHPFWLTRGLLGEGRYWLDSALARSPEEQSVERAKALYADCMLTVLQGDLDAASDPIRDEQARFGQSSDPLAHAHLAHADGLLALYNGELPRAQSRLLDALTVFDDGRDLCAQVESLLQLGWAFQLDGNAARALEFCEQALTLTKSRGESVYRSYALLATGVAVWRQGDQSCATQLLEDGLQLTRMRYDPLVTAACLEALAWIEAADGHANRAAVLIGAATALGQSVDSTTVLIPGLAVYQDNCEEETRRALGTEGFEKLRQKGSHFGADAAIAFALGEKVLSTPTAELTKRELQVSDLIAQGLTNKQIAAQLVISPRTAQGHVEHILCKLGFTSRTQIATWRVEHNQDETD